MKIKTTESGIAYVDLEKSIHWIKDRVLYDEYKEGVEITLEDAKHMLDVDDFLTAGGKCIALTDTRKGVSMTGEARRYFARHTPDVVLAAGVVIRQKYGRVMANLFLHIDKPSMPVKFFNEMEQAQLWVEKNKVLLSKGGGNSVFHPKYKVDEGGFLFLGGSEK